MSNMMKITMIYEGFLDECWTQGGHHRIKKRFVSPSEEDLGACNPLCSLPSQLDNTIESVRRANDSCSTIT